jgi:cyclopropane fatty-acyl-phospholipid synthase-like methyltransferase
MLGFLRLIPYFLLEPFQSTVKTPDGVPIPPTWKMFDGPRDKQIFLQNSTEVLEVYKRYGALRPDSKVLDVGSGLGRKTLALPSFLGTDGKYIGVDIVRQGVDWCNQNIATSHPNFIFLHLNVFNARYNRRGTVRASDYRFPFADGSFDLITAWSVFTHMLPNDIKNYLRETSRMLKPSGRCIFSFYVMTDKTTAAVKNGSAKERVEHEIEDGVFTDNKSVPEDLTAFKESWIRSIYETSGLSVENILHGSWSGDNSPRSFPMTNYQDIVVARRA